MTQRSSGPAGPPAGEDWPDNLWPDDDPTGSAAAPGGAPAARRVRPALLAVIIAAALAAGAVVTEAVHDFSGAAPASSAGPGRSGGSRLPVRRIGGAGPGRVLGPGGAAGAGASMFVLGTVTAVSHTSITIGGPGHTVTAAVTGATRITGKATGIGGIKVGDQVSAQLTEKGGRVTAVAIAYPAQAPGGGVVP